MATKRSRREFDAENKENPWIKSCKKAKIDNMDTAKNILTFAEYVCAPLLSECDIIYFCVCLQ